MTFANIHPRNAQLDILTPQVKSRMRQIIAINDVPALRKIITSTNINNSPDALQHAIAIGRIDCVEAMVELGFSLQCTDGAGRSLLHCACPTQPNCVKYLLHKQLSIDHHDNRGLTALHWACQCRSHDCRLLLLHHDSHYHHGHSPTLSRSVWHLPGVPHWPQHLNNLRKPDLHQPDRNAHRTDCLALLVNKGADISRRDLRGRTALHYAVWCNKVNAARLIVDAGLPVDVFDNFGETPLHMACHIGNLDAVCFLLARGASINTRNHFMEAPLHAAVAGCHEKVLKLLLDWGAALYLKDDIFHMTPLESAEGQNLHWASKAYRERGTIPTLQVICRNYMVHLNAHLYIHIPPEPIVPSLKYDQEIAGHKVHTNANGSHIAPGPGSQLKYNYCAGTSSSGSLASYRSPLSGPRNTPGPSDPAYKDQQFQTSHENVVPQRRWGYVDANTDFNTPLVLDVYNVLSEELQTYMIG